MFNEIQLENVFYNDRPVKSVGSVVDEDKGGEMHHQVVVTFADTLSPACEIMHKEEWESMKSEGPKTQERPYYFQEATYKLQSRILKEIESFNPRWNEIGSLLERLRYAHDELMNKSLEGLFGKPLEKVTFNDLFGILDKHKAEVSFDGKNEVALKLIAFCKAEDISLADVQNAHAHLFDMMGVLKEKARELEMGVPLPKLRLDHIIQQAEKAPKEEESKA